jgi:6-phosphogluconolactonase
LLSGCGGGDCDSCHRIVAALDVTVSGLVGSRLTLVNNGAGPGRTIGPAANGTYPDFFGPLPSGGSYNITVETQPTNPSQTCQVANGTGTIGGGVIDISVTCTTRPGRFLYALNFAGIISAYAIDSSSGALTAINGSPFPAPSPGFGISATTGTIVIVDPSGTFAYAAYYGGQSDNYLAVFAIDPASGALTEVGPVVSIPEVGGPTSMSVDPSGRFLYVTNTRNQIFTYQITAGALELTNVYGPLPMADGGLTLVTVDPLGRIAYALVNPCAPNSCPGAVLAFTLDSTSGVPTAIAMPAIPSGDVSTSMVINPHGTLAYVANSDSSDISGYAIDPFSGRLLPLNGSPFAEVQSPNSLAVDPFGKFLYTTNNSNTVSAYAINARSGALQAVSGGLYVPGGYALAVMVDPTGRFLYVLNGNGNSDYISAYTINPITGGLAPISGSPFATEPFTSSIAISD